MQSELATAFNVTDGEIDEATYIMKNGTTQDVSMIQDGKVTPETKIREIKARQAGEFEPFPIYLLPPVVRDFVSSTSRAMGCDPAMVALPALAACAGAIGAVRTIELKDGWQEPAILWAVVVASSGTLKSPSLEAAVKPIFRAQADAIEQHKKAVEEHRKQEDRSTPAPTCTRYVVSDCTLERMAVILEDNQRGLLLCRDELSAWLTGFDRYKNRSSGEVEQWLEMSRGGQLLVDRKRDHLTVSVPRACVSVVGTTQPGTLQSCLTSEMFNRGMAARLLLAYPPRVAKKWSKAKVAPATRSAYAEMLERLMQLDFDPKGKPIALKMTSQAEVRWVDFYNAWAHQMIELDDDLASAWSKLEGYAARLALVHALSHTVTLSHGHTQMKEEVGLESMEAGIGLALWFSREAQRVYTLFAETPEERDVRMVAELSKRNGGQLTIRQLQRSNQRRFRSSKDAESLLSKMVDMGHGSWADSTTYVPHDSVTV